MTDEEVLEYARQLICNYIVLQQGVPKDITFNIDDVYAISYINVLGIWRVVLKSSLEDDYIYIVEVDVDNPSNDCFYMLQDIEAPNNKERIFSGIPDDEETKKLMKKTNKTLYTEVDTRTRVGYRADIRDRDDLLDGAVPSETFSLELVQKN